MRDLTAVAADVAIPDALPDARPAAAGYGRLGSLARWLAEVQGAAQPAEPRRVRLVAFVAEHAVGSAGLSAQTLEEVSALAARLEADGSGLAGAVGASVVVHRLPQVAGRIDREDAFASEDVAALIETGMAVADAEIDSGADLLLPVALGAGSTTAAAALVSVATGVEPVKAVGRGAAAAGPIDDETWMRKTAAVRDARRRALPARHDPTRLLAVAGGADLAALAGLLARSAARRTPALLDGSVVTAAALLVHRLQPRAVRWWQAAHRTPDITHLLALDRLNLDAMVDLGITAQDGTGPLLAVPILRAAAALPLTTQARQ